MFSGGGSIKIPGFEDEENCRVRSVRALQSTPLLPSRVGSACGGTALEGRLLLGCVHWNGFLSSHLASSLPPKEYIKMFEIPAGARHLLIQEADTTSHYLCESEPTPVRPSSFGMGRVPMVRAEYQSSEAWLVCPGPESNSPMDRRASAPDHLLGFHTCIFWGRPELGVRGHLWQQPQAMFLQSVEAWKTTLSEGMGLGSRSHTEVSLVLVEQPKTGCGSQSKLGYYWQGQTPPSGSWWG